LWASEDTVFESSQVNELHATHLSLLGFELSLKLLDISLVLGLFFSLDSVFFSLGLAQLLFFNGSNIKGLRSSNDLLEDIHVVFGVVLHDIASFDQLIQFSVVNGLSTFAEALGFSTGEIHLG